MSMPRQLKTAAGGIGCASLALYITGGVLLVGYGVVVVIFLSHRFGGTYILGGWGNLVLGIVYLFLGVFISRKSIIAWVIATILVVLQFVDGLVENIIVWSNFPVPNPGGPEPELLPVLIALIALIALIVAYRPIRAHERAYFDSVEVPQGVTNTSRPRVAGILAIVAGILIIVAAALFGYYATMMPFVAMILGIDRVIAAGPTVLSIVAASVVLAAVAIAGGDQARKRKSWGLSLAGSICSLVCFLPLGIPAIILLTRSKAEFR